MLETVLVVLAFLIGFVVGQIKSVHTYRKARNLTRQAQEFYQQVLGKTEEHKAWSRLVLGRIDEVEKALNDAAEKAKNPKA